MSDCGKQIRLNRIFGPSGRKALVVALDHGLVLGPLPGMTHPQATLQQVGRCGVDGILVNLGILRRCFHTLLIDSAPPLIVRLDWTSAWKEVDNGGKLRSELLAQPEQALRNGADAVLTYLFVGTGDMEFEAREIARNAQVARECERLGVPLIVESLARGKQVDNPSSPNWLNFHSRVAAELGADVIKTDYAGSPALMREVVETCPIPILVLGGAKNPVEEHALDVVRGTVEAGAAGVFIGRNVFQANDVASFLSRVRAILDGNLSK
jgi:fructose-bisphosphate aldolase, class I